jgi:hypothetical protein
MTGPTTEATNAVLAEMRLIAELNSIAAWIFACSYPLARVRATSIDHGRAVTVTSIA